MLVKITSFFHFGRSAATTASRAAARTASTANQTSNSLWASTNVFNTQHEMKTRDPNSSANGSPGYADNNTSQRYGLVNIKNRPNVTATQWVSDYRSNNDKRSLTPPGDQVRLMAPFGAQDQGNSIYQPHNSHLADPSVNGPIGYYTPRFSTFHPLPLSSTAKTNGLTEPHSASGSTGYQFDLQAGREMPPPPHKAPAPPPRGSTLSAAPPSVAPKPSQKAMLNLAEYRTYNAGDSQAPLTGVTGSQAKPGNILQAVLRQGIEGQRAAPLGKLNRKVHFELTPMSLAEQLDVQLSGNLNFNFIIPQHPSYPPPEPPKGYRSKLSLAPEPPPVDYTSQSASFLLPQPSFAPPPLFPAPSKMAHSALPTSAQLQGVQLKPVPRQESRPAPADSFMQELQGKLKGKHSASSPSSSKTAVPLLNRKPLPAIPSQKTPLAQPFASSTSPSNAQISLMMEQSLDLSSTSSKVKSVAPPPPPPLPLASVSQLPSSSKAPLPIPKTQESIQLKAILQPKSNRQFQADALNKDLAAALSKRRRDIDGNEKKNESNV